MTEFFRAITIFGGTEVVLVGVVFVIAFLLFRRMWRQAIFVALIVLFTELSVFLIKRIVALPRPSEALWLVEASGFSFPSGHAALAVAFYGALWYIIFSSINSPTAKIFWTAFVVLVVGLVAVSRVVLGVHYLPDVFAGIVIGVAWLSVGIAFLKSRKRELRM